MSMINMEIAYAPDEFVEIILDDVRFLAKKDVNGEIHFSEKFDEIDDDKLYDSLVNFCKTLLS